MMRLFVMTLLIAALVVVGCSKKQDEIDALQQEAAGRDAAAVMDSLERAGREAADMQPLETARTPVSEPEPEPDYYAMEGFVVQLGSYNDYELAAYWAERYQNREFPAFLRQVEMEGRVYYRLRVGVYETYEEAKQIGELLADRYSASYWIDYNR